MFKIFLIITIAFTHSYSEKIIVIDLKEQKLYAKDGGKTFLTSPISSGMVGHETPQGTFSIVERDKNHKSNLYPRPLGGEWGDVGGAKMPFMLKFKHSGEAIHSGNLPGYPNSHGCVRVPFNKAKKLYSWASVGVTVRVVNKPKYNDKTSKIRIKAHKRGEGAAWVDDGKADNWGMDEVFSYSVEKNLDF